MSRKYKTYFAVDTYSRTVKIGRSVNPENRMRQIRCRYKIPFWLVGYSEGDYEKLFMFYFKEHRIGGELFRLEGSLERFVVKMPAVFDAACSQPILEAQKILQGKRDTLSKLLQATA